MPETSTWPLILLAALAGLAGCLGASEDDVPRDPATNGSQGSGPPLADLNVSWLEPAMATSPTDPDVTVLAANVVVGPESEAFETEGSPWIGVRATEDGGDAWTRELLAGHPASGESALGPYCFLSDPSVAFAPDGTTAYVAGMVGEEPPCERAPGPLDTVFLAELDPETSETRAHVLDDPSVPIGPPATADRPWVHVGGDGVVHLAWTQIQGRSVGRIAHVAWDPSSDAFGDVSFPGSGGSAGIPTGADFAEDGQGRLHLVWLNLEKAQISHAIRADGVWRPGEPIPVAPYCSAFAGFCPPTIPATAVTDPYIAATDGGLTVVWTDTRAGAPRTLVTTSTDGGETWDPPAPVASDPSEGEHIFPGLAVHDGMVWITELQLGSDQETYEPAAYIQCPGAEGYEPIELGVQPAPFDPDGSGFTFIGHHYVDPTVTPDGLLYPWVAFEATDEGERGILSVERAADPCSGSAEDAPARGPPSALQ